MGGTQLPTPGCDIACWEKFGYKLTMPKVSLNSKTTGSEELWPRKGKKLTGFLDIRQIQDKEDL